MQWSEIPVYSVKAQYLKQKLVRAARRPRARVEHPGQRQPPVGDRLVDRQRAQRAARPGPGRLHRRAARAAQGARPDAPGRARGRRLPVGGLPARVRAARRHRRQRLLRLVPRARAARSPTARCSPTTSTRCAPATRTRRSSSPSSARRPTATGPVEEKGTYAFQQDFVNYHLGIYATKPWLSGAIYFALQEFRVRPELGRRQPAAPARRSTRRAWSPSTACASRRSSTSSGSSRPPSSSAPCHDPGYDDRDGRPPASRCDGGGRREGADAGGAHGALGVDGRSEQSAARAERRASRTPARRPRWRPQ